MANHAIETVMGAVVLTVAGGFLYFAYNSSNVKPIEGYAVTAGFTNVSGIQAGSDVRIGGIKVGGVEKLDLDPKTYQAVATLRVADNVKLPKDSTAAIQSTGLLGDKFVAITPGGDDADLKNGDRIVYTESSVNIEEMIGKFAFSGGGVDKGGAAPAAASEPDAAAPKSTASPAVSSGLK
ncbi:MAG: outer membrane lipid asymmetry maintenance protein MlaD [Alphaproteobacteria bacterium]